MCSSQLTVSKVFSSGEHGFPPLRNALVCKEHEMAYLLLGVGRLLFISSDARLLLQTRNGYGYQWLCVLFVWYFIGVCFATEFYHPPFSR